MSDGTFDFDLIEGKLTENGLLRLILGGKVEVKDDKASERTGNICIEYKQWKKRGIPAEGYKPSGILATTADWWAIRFHADRFLLIRTAYLKRIFDRAVHEATSGDPLDRDVRLQETGDNGNWSAIIPVERFFEAETRAFGREIKSKSREAA